MREWKLPAHKNRFTPEGSRQLAQHDNITVYFVLGRRFCGKYFCAIVTLSDQVISYHASDVCNAGIPEPYKTAKPTHRRGKRGAGIGVPQDFGYGLRYGLS